MKAIDQKPAKNIGKTTLTYHDSGDDNLITIEVGEEVTLLSKSGKIIVGNRSTAKKGKLRFWVVRR